ncbi:restriction endonuclease subunit S [Roseiconus lacunae]|uniref:restriction endonuclease subunit S n=1 Tax=Roseiconus lacunae TaxID=2605694 RepID=UPI001E639FE7|nr:restriction endonuclease subunit S [Roseiconus lacunae]
MNETLESMARALFKSWFVDFDPVIDNALAAGSSIAEPLAARASAREALGDQRKPLPENIRTLFPASFIFDEEMGWIPEGWEISRVEDVSVAVGMGPFGSNIKTDTFVDTGVPIVNGQQLNGLLLQDGKNNFITESHAEKLHKSLVYRGDLVFTHRGTIGQVSLVPNESEYERYIASQSQMYLRPDSQLITSLYLIHLFQSHLGQAALLANRSQVGVPSIARPSSHLKNIRLLVPDRRCLQAFDNNCSQWIERIAQTRVNTKVLAKLRDTLLPKLLSGELRIPEAEKLVADNV